MPHCRFSDDLSFMGTTLSFFITILAKGNSFCDFLFASLDEIDPWATRSLLTLLHSERPKLHAILAFLNVIGLKGVGREGLTVCFLE